MKRLAILLVFAACVSAPPPPAFDQAKLREVDAAVEKAIAGKRTPGGVIWIERDGAIYTEAYGNRALEPAVEEMTKDTIFDAASITKVVATAPSIWLLIERGKISLDAPIREYLPGFTDDAVTIRHLLTHTSGLRPSLDLREPWSGYDEGIRRALEETPRNRPGAIFRYSDINYILLGEIVRRVSGQPLEVFARENIFEPLQMRDTGYWPNGSPRIAPTERVIDDPLAPNPLILRGVVHDPTARRMGGVAGHAGMFTTAEDLAKFARAVLGGTFFPKAMTDVNTPAGVAVRRAGGFDIDSPYSRPRGEYFPAGTSFGHTGWTGGFLWIDPASHSFYIFLSNRVHPDGKGSVTALQKQIGTLAAQSLLGATFQRQQPRVGWVIGGGDAQNGIDVLTATRFEALEGMRVGLITNHTGVDRAGNPTIDLLRSAPNVTLAALFSPEHGIRGTADDKLGDEVDTVTGLTIFSLYGERRKPSAEQLKGLDALVFDIQDIGARFYTYISTMGMAMEAAADAKIKFIVLDRVNPIGADLVEGPILEGETNFIGWHTLPVRHGMTVGELAKLFGEEKNIDVDLTVIPIRGWERAQWQDAAGLPWVNTSPNIRNISAAGLYPGLGLLERAISVGRGTDTPFEIIGAPFIDGERLARELQGFPGVAFEPVRFTPRSSNYKGEECGGVRITITDRKALRAVDLGVTIASTLARLYPAQFKVDDMAHLLRHRATLEAIRAAQPLDRIRALWDTDAFIARRAKYLLYK